MNDATNTWTEDDTALYHEIAPVAVPARDEQVATILTLMPFSRDAPFRAVDLGCGTGVLSYAILDHFPRASVLALDGSETMLSHARSCLSNFGRRVNLARFELASGSWFAQLDGTDCVVSSLFIHHLPGDAKRGLFSTAFRRLTDPGAFLIADLVEPQRPESWALYADTWDRRALTQSRLQTGSLSLFRKFKDSEWNYFRYPDPADKPSPLFDQLVWLKEAGFRDVDCFWLQAGHAIFGGYKGRIAPNAPQPSFEVALQSARAALGATG
jgi:tRNA (cmo5U34)-methyltransferase